jgi:4-aminobutyrate aminotransferase-like enzyme/Ser/Thr protein kinase RdoA (MazF antagonist)
MKAAPRFTPSDAAAMARAHWGLECLAAVLPSERDQNFRIDTLTGERFVLKIAQAGESRSLLECQNALLERLGASTRFTCSKLVPTRRSEAIVEVAGEGGRMHLARMLTFVPGRPLGTLPAQSNELLNEVGALIADVSNALEAFEHPAARRELHWDLRHARQTIERHIGAVSSPERNDLVSGFLPLLERHAPLFDLLPQSVIHGDANDYNILVETTGLQSARVIAMIDVGDTVQSWTIGDLAIAMAYVMLGKRDPLAAARAVLQGYVGGRGISEAEIEALYPLICARLCTSVTLAAHQTAQRPENAYLSISEAAAWTLLAQLAALNPDMAHYGFRAACGIEPHPNGAALRLALRTHAHEFGSLLDGHDIHTAPALDLSISGTHFGALPVAANAGEWMRAIDEVLRRNRATAAIGRYAEPRGWYTDPAFRVETEEAPEWRTVHIGMDLFAPAETRLFAPLDGTVHSVHDNAGHLDYGPTLILQHQLDGITFYTLYGHLARTSVAGLKPGQRWRRGDPIGALGHPVENGGWAPHVHVQIIADMLDFENTFPGVARPSELPVWTSLSPDPAPLLGIVHVPPASTSSRIDELLERREQSIGPSLSIAYQRPLVIVRGWMQHLYDELGQPYLDAVNNVAHVGHCHPRVVQAIRRQVGVLNTNTRYLHESLLRLAERLTALLPEPLSVAYFTCSGSEANELALRMARTHTGRHDVVVLDVAYHGNTTSLIELSPYKFNGPGGGGRAPYVHVVPLPDGYRGVHRGSDAEAGRAYASHVREACEKASIAAFFAEPLPGCGGQIVPPAGFLANAFQLVRDAGGVCVADEVQTGLGRVGTHYWAFETQSVVPDIVTIGKPFGNGHPIAAVVTTPEIAASFNNGMEYFNTFGGNAVSCAAALAVLDAIEEDGLQANAQRVGERMLGALRALMARHPVIGDVRGRGLYIGVELVTNRTTREPATSLAAHVVNRMRDHGILLSTDGADHNVLKIKPPMVFTADDADRVAATLDRVLQELG